MVNSKYEYVRKFETSDKLLPNTWIVIRLDGCGFHKFSSIHEFEKPNDVRALNLMNEAASVTMKAFPDIILAYGNSDEYSFVFQKTCHLYERRSSKLTSIVVSLFTSNYVFLWPRYFKDKMLMYPPSFDARSILYPSKENIRDYLSWRQVDCHINNLYNTAFWALVQKGGMSTTDAEKTLMGTLAKDKNELLFSKFGINYNNEHEMFKKGSVLLRNSSANNLEKTSSKNTKQIAVLHVDIIGDPFWDERPSLLK
ncbi:tRNA guanylyltransferase [Pneumocystis jirovecii RU7]|uniref:tRNA(His) guanylyltransferase n=1 Tax=Pneumocystis jirovecii (strain RU7) TaxID=1408657 RepID=A0A0W4ZV70_PNEJ7|nr:tRNA guanylyltransferase [Pneumocystis jirovecii RU7]KTW32277.1 hypothetical protein T551_00368 [Pneumocystis jirovecii RU7]